MSSSGHETDSRKLPVPLPAKRQEDIEHHRTEWTSGTRGGGKVPHDFTWGSNPKQQQEEKGSGSA